MYLKSIELAGFKSFNERTVLKLEDGISCIVGPNGSGKSNIADAVRWVLGEQSAKVLRGHKMEDVIFAGTDKLKSLGMAEVVLNIDNSDGALPVEFSDVAVCRRAYRNGESEYLMNGKQCRLTDIRELFMDSGVSNNSLALIGQGRIQQVVDMRPEERRSLLEEAAGIVKYRTRKRTAERKLADTEQNLARVWDIISELNGRLEPLKEQSDRAEEYLSLKATADTSEINLLLQNLEENRQKLEETVASLGQKRDEQTGAVAAQDKAEGELAGLRLQNDRTEEQLGVARQQLFDLKTTKDQTRAEGDLLRERIKAAEQNVSRIQAELDLLLTRDDGFVAQVNRLNEQKEQAARELAAIKQDLQAKECDFAESREQLDELAAEQEQARQEIFDSASQLANTRNELGFLARSLEETRQTAAQMQQTVADIEQDNVDFDGQIAAVQAEIDGLQARREQGKAELAALNNRLNQLEQRMVKANEQTVATRLKLNSEESRLKVLGEMAENKSGFYPGVRSIVRAAERGVAEAQGVLGVVLDLIESDVKYSQALEAAAGANLQNIVVTDDRAARDCVAYLKREQLGRATFLPLASLRMKENRELEQALTEKGVIGRCADVVRCNDKVRRAIDFIFANILLVDDLDTATRVARNRHQQLRIVTLAGDIIAPGGSITGGSRQKNSGDLLQKKNQLAELKKSVKTLAENLAKEQNELQKLTAERQQLEQKRSELLADERTTEIAYMGRVKDIGHMRDGRADKDAQLARLKRDLQENGREQERLIRRQTELEADIANWDEQSRRAGELLHGVQARHEQQAKLVEAARLALEQGRLDELAKRQAYTNLVTEVDRLTSAKSSLFEEQAQKQQTKESLMIQLDKLTVDLSQRQQQEQAYAGKIAAAEDELGGLTNESAATRQRIEELEKAAAEFGRQSLTLTGEIHQLEVKEARLQTENEAESAKLLDGFNMTYEEALPYLNMEVGRQELARRLKGLKSRIAALGNVNIEAIEEYRQVRERHEFLSAQREDMLDAHEQLKNVIKEMNSIMSRRFKETFEQVNLNFAQTFNQLFGGGTAALVLVEPDDVLESGVDMMVQPPGKRLINYNLLSGGEKSLIGVALVLAIFQVKPSPFCILDEVDAALDEANVERFAEYIKMFKVKTQFVVVTHRQGTMEAADRLWGVTMEKNGISRLVSVKLSDNMNEYIS